MKKLEKAILGAGILGFIGASYLNYNQAENESSMEPRIISLRYIDSDNDGKFDSLYVEKVIGNDTLVNVKAIEPTYKIEVSFERDKEK